MSGDSPQAASYKDGYGETLVLGGVIGGEPVDTPSEAVNGSKGILVILGFFSDSLGGGMVLSETEFGKLDGDIAGGADVGTGWTGKATYNEEVRAETCRAGTRQTSCRWREIRVWA